MDIPDGIVKIFERFARNKLPYPPCSLAPSYFIVSEKVKTAIHYITECLNSMIRLVSFEFHGKQCIWDCVFVHRSAFAKFEIRLYDAGEKNKIIVEGNRLNGDSYSFYIVYNAIKSAFKMNLCVDKELFYGMYAKDNIKSNTTGSVISDISNVLEEAEALERIEPFLKMAQNKNIHSQEISTNVFCDLTHQPNMEHVLYLSNAIEIMSQLLNVICSRCDISSVQQHFMHECNCTTINRLVILAISELSNKSKFHTQIMKAPHLLRNLFKFAIDGQFYNIHMRRAAALIIANCSTKGWANTIVNTIGKESLKIWFNSTACIKDKILKNEIERSKKALRKVMNF